MAKTGLEKYNARVKQIKKSGKTHKQAQRQASAEVKAHGRGAKVAGVDKKRPAKRVAKRKSRVGTKPKYKVVHEVRRINGISYKGGSVTLAGVGTVDRQKAALKATLGQQAGWLEVAISSAKTKREKEVLRKKKRQVLSELNRIK